MGGEFGQWREWAHDESLEWHLLQYPAHSGVHRWVSDLNRVYREHSALYQAEFDAAGFEWIDCSDVEHSVISFIRKGRSRDETIVIVCNFTPVTRFPYRIGAPKPGFWKELLNSDAKEYGGGGQGNLGGVQAATIPFHGRPYSLTINLPPLAIVFFEAPR
jgi:1,4-alpha-glucan branching enzyme